MISTPPNHNQLIESFNKLPIVTYSLLTLTVTAFTVFVMIALPRLTSAG